MITNLINEKLICLDLQATTKDAVFREMIEMLSAQGKVKDKLQFLQDVQAREAIGNTGFEDGIALPHAKSHAVIEPAVVIGISRKGVDYGAEDGKPSKLFFMIASPAGGADHHIGVLAELSSKLIETGFVDAIMAAKSSREALALLTAKAAPVTAPSGVSKGFLIGVTGCPAGIAHTYLAAEALEKAAKELGYKIKVETNGSIGVKNAPTAKEIADADAIIVSCDKQVDMHRFAGKKVIKTSVKAPIKDAKNLIKQALAAAPYQPQGNAMPAEGNKSTQTRSDLYRFLMNGVSHMIPFITGGGILIALSYFLDRGNAGAEMFGRGTSLAMLVRTIGNTSFNLMYVVLAGFIAMSVGDLPALVAGMAGGMLAIQGTSLAPQAEWVSSGFWGAMIAGFAAGLVVKLLRTAFKRLPSALVHIKTVLLYPVASLAVVGFMMVFLVNAPLGRFNTWIYQLLASMQGGSRVVMAAVLGALMAVDFGGPINKAAYLFGTVALAGGQEEFMAAVMAGGMVPPLGVALAGTLFPERFTTKERHTAMTNYLMGACFITEGVVPFVLRDPLHVIPSCMVGASLAAALSMLFGCAVPAPHGGMFLLPLNPHPFRYLLALLMGSLLTAVTLAALRRKYPPKDEEQPTK